MDITFERLSLMEAFENALDPKIKVRCSFIIIQSDVDERSVVLRYLAKHDITGTQGDTDDEDEKPAVYKESEIF